MSEFQNLNEMPIKAVNLRSDADKYAQSLANYYASNKNKFTHVGDIEEFKVLRDLYFWFVIDSTDSMVLTAKVSKIPPEGAVIDDVWVDSTQSGKKLFSKFLWFLVSREGIKPLFFGNVHSEETYDLLKLGGFSKFKKTWVNDFEGSAIPFDVNDIDKFYLSSRWKLKLESTEQLEELIREVKSTKFNQIGESWIRLCYDWQLI